jgi:hypothetical protein
MIGEIVISKGFLKFLVTVSANGPKVETYGACKYEDKVCDTFARSEQLMIEHYLRTEKLPVDSFEQLVTYLSEKGWAVIRVAQEVLEENKQVK